MDEWEVRCPSCGVNVARRPPCPVCRRVPGCCDCYHEDD